MKKEVMLERLSEAIDRLNDSDWSVWELIEIPEWNEDKLGWDRDNIKEVRLTISMTNEPPEDSDKIDRTRSEFGNSRGLMFDRVIHAEKQHIYRGVEKE